MDGQNTMTDRWTDRQTDRQTHGPTDRQTDRPVWRQEETTKDTSVVSRTAWVSWWWRQVL